MARQIEPERLWSALPVPIHNCAQSLFATAIQSEVGNGANTKFWMDRWLNGCSIEVLAPHLFACVHKRRANRRAVPEPLTNNVCVRRACVCVCKWGVCCVSKVF